MDNKEKLKKDKIVIQRIEEELQRIDKKENNIYFFVTSTHGIVDETIDYVYKMALLLKENGYNVGLIQQDENFEGNKWLGNKEYDELKVYDISKGEVNVGVSDILFIPEVFASVMNQTTKLPCKRIAIIQSVSYLTKFMPLSSQLADFGIFDVLTFDESEAELIKQYFPYANIYIAHTFIDDFYFSKKELKDMTVNIISKNQEYVNKIAKPFYWKYPLYKWITFKDMRGLSQTELAYNLAESSITIWIDDDSNNGFDMLASLASDNIVIAKIPDVIPSWVMNEENKFNNSIIWVNSITEIPQVLSNIIRAIITNKIPNEIIEDSKNVIKQFSKNRSFEEINNVVNDILEKRRIEINNLLNNISKK